MRPNRKLTKKPHAAVKRKPAIAKGKSTVRLLLLISLIIAACIGGGYFLLNKNSSSTVNPEAVRQTEQKLSYIQDPILRRHFAVMSNVKKVRIIEPAHPKLIEEVEIIDPVNKIINAKYWNEQNGKRMNYLIAMGDTFYAQDTAGNTWWKGIHKINKDYFGDSAVFGDFYSDHYRYVTNNGEELCPGNSLLICYKYAISTGGIKANSNKLWFDNREYLLRKLVITIDMPGTDPYETDYEYGNINIQAPSLIKDIPPGKEDLFYENQFKKLKGEPVTSDIPENEQTPADPNATPTLMIINQQ